MKHGAKLGVLLSDKLDDLHDCLRKIGESGTCSLEKSSRRNDESIISVNNRKTKSRHTMNQRRPSGRNLKIYGNNGKIKTNVSSPRSIEKSSTGETVSQAELEEVIKKMKLKDTLFLQREEKLLNQIMQLQSENNALKERNGLWKSTGESTQQLQAIHSDIMKGVESVHEKAKLAVSVSKDDIERVFRTQLYLVEEQLEAEKYKQEHGSNIWAKQKQVLSVESKWAQNVALNLQKTNDHLVGSKTSLKQGLEVESSEKEFLLKQLVVVKRDNIFLKDEIQKFQSNEAQLRDQVAELQKDLKKQNEFILSRPGNTVQDFGSIKQTKQYENTIKRLKKLLTTERKHLEAARKQFVAHENLQHGRNIFTPGGLGNVSKRNIATPLLRQVFSFPELRNRTSPIGVHSNGLK